MSQADVERFVADLKKDPALLKQVQGSSTGLASVVSLAKSKGYDVTMDEAKAYIDQQAKKELSDDQLDAVAGGKGGGGGGGGSNAAAVTQAVAVASVAEAVSVATTGVEAAEVATTIIAVAEGVIVLT